VKVSELQLIVTGSIARSAKRWYLCYSEGDFGVICPIGATHCSDDGEIWHGGVDLRSTPLQISPGFAAMIMV